MVHDLIEDRRAYPLGRVKHANVELLVLNGSLAVTGGADEFCSALIEYSHPELRPLDEYEVDGDRAEFSLRQPETHGLRRTRNSWHLAFNSGVTLGLAVESMSGGVNLDLDRVLLSDLEVKSRSGSVRASMAGSYPDLGEIVIESKSGTVTADLPGTYPKLSNVEIESMSGKTELAISGACPELRSVKVESRSGKTDLALTGECPQLQRVDVDALSGAVDLDLRGAFQRDDLGVRIESKSGAVRVRLPEGVGASLNATTMSGRVRADGFNTGTGRRTNAAFERTPATIWLNVRVMSGSVEIVTG